MIPIQQRRHLECPVSQHDTMEPSSVGPTKMVALSPLYPGYPQKDDLLKFPVVHLFWEPNWPWFSMLMQLSVPVISAKPSWGFTGNSNFWMPQPHFDHAKYRKQALLNQPLWVGQGVTMQISAARACWDHHMAPDGRHTGKTQAFPQVLLLLFFVWGEGLLRSPKTEAPKYQNILLWRKSKCATMLGTGDVHFSSPRTGGTLCAWSPVKNARLFGIKYRDPATQCCPKCHQRSLSWKTTLDFINVGVHFNHFIQSWALKTRQTDTLLPHAIATLARSAMPLAPQVTLGAVAACVTDVSLSLAKQASYWRSPPQAMINPNEHLGKGCCCRMPQLSSTE